MCMHISKENRLIIAGLLKRWLVFFNPMDIMPIKNNAIHIGMFKSKTNTSFNFISSLALQG